MKVFHTNLKKLFFISGIQDSWKMAERILQYVHESRCKFRVEADRTSTNEIESGIRFLINDIVKRIEKTAPEFKILDIIPTGSSYEGTKNEAPNEFDFMLILKELSGP